MHAAVEPMITRSYMRIATPTTNKPLSGTCTPITRTKVFIFFLIQSTKKTWMIEWQVPLALQYYERHGRNQGAQAFLRA
jgi:hypothetical protein